MTPWFRREKRDEITKFCIRLAVLTDAVACGVSLTLAHLIRYKVLPNSFLMLNHTRIAEGIIMGIIIYLILNVLFNAYRPYSLLRFRRSFVIIFKSITIWIFAFSSVALFFSLIPNISRIFILLSFLLMMLFGISARWVLQKILYLMGYTSAFRQRILFIDWTPRMNKLAEEITKDPWHAYEIAGIAPPKSNKFNTTPNFIYPVLGSHSEVADIFSRGLVNIALLADAQRSDEETASIASLCEQNLVSFMIVPTEFQILLTGLQVTSISRVPVLGITELPLEVPINALLKRFFDILGSLVGLIIFSPIISIFLLLVWIESPGPVFYWQVRTGRKGRIFRIIKIRSMKLDAEKDTGPVWSTQNDDRRLKIGAFMRRWNIDELPQFWNVLKGDMSLVGPRPERPELIINFKETINHYNARHNVNPGITGWAAVNGLRGDTDISERIRYDLYYMENWSLALDFQIIIMTFFNYKGAA